MRVGRFVVTAVSLLVLVITVTSTDAASQTLEAEVDAYLKPLVDDDLISGCVLVAKQGEVLLAKGYGSANREYDIPVTPDTRFRLGSVSKQFTAAAILILEQQGKLSTDDPVSKYYPEFPKGDQITIHHLLTHTSGIININNLPEYGEKIRLPLATQEVIDWFKDEPLQFEPGERFSYSNSGYILAAGIIERITGQSFADFMQQQVFGPLGMTQSGQDDHMEIIKQRARGHYGTGPEIKQAPYRYMPFMAGAGSIYSSVTDLYKWDQALYRNDFLSEASKTKMFTPHIDTYGYGWFIEELLGHKVITHRGAINGFLSNIDRFVDDSIVVIALWNYESTFAPIVRTGLAAIALGEDYVPPLRAEPFPIPADSLQACVGEYEITTEIHVTVTLNDGDLYLQESGESPLKAVAQKPNRYFVRGMNSMVWFDYADNGSVTALRGMQGAHGFRARRIAP